MDDITLDTAVWLTLQAYGVLPYNVVFMRDPKMLSYSNIYLQENYSNIQEKQAEICMYYLQILHFYIFTTYAIKLKILLNC